MMLLLCVMTCASAWAETVTYTFYKANDISYIVYNGNNYKLNDNLLWTTGTATCGDVVVTINSANNGHGMEIVINSYVPNGYSSDGTPYSFSFSSSSKYISHIKIYTTQNHYEADNDTREHTTPGLWNNGGYGRFYQVDLTLSDTQPVFTYNITYVLNGGTNAPGNPTTYTNLTGATLADATKTGYTFGGWYDNAQFNGEPINYIQAGMNGDKTVYAKWTANTYTVSFNNNGGTGTMSNQSFTYDVSQALTSNTFTRTGYTFAGWATTADGDVVYTDGQTVSNLASTQGANVELFAKWSPVLSYFWGEGDGSEGNPYIISTKEGLDLLATLVNGGNNFSGKYFLQTADITLNGSFTPIGIYTDDSNRKFSGTYDGGDNTISGLTISGNHRYAGLFGQVDTGGTVKNVRLVNPSVTSSFSGASVAALIGGANRCTAQNCLVVNPTVSATANSSNNNVGVLFGYLSNGTVQNCMVISPTVSGVGTNQVGVICGYAQNGGTDYHCTLTNVYYYNSSLNAIGNNVNGAYSRLTNVGPVRKVTLGSGMANVNPEATNMANGFVCNNETYYRENLTLTLTDNLGTTSEGYTKHYYANGTDLNGSTTYTVNSTDGDVTFTADCRSDGQPHAVTYVDANGTEHSTNAIPLDGNETATIEYGNSWVHLAGGTYYVGTDITYTSKIVPDGTINLILGNGCTMTLANDLTGIEETGRSLTIYGQSLDHATAGTLCYNGTRDGIRVGYYTQHSGNVSLTTSYNYSAMVGLHANNVNLLGGKLTVSANSPDAIAIDASLTVTVTGGQLDATATGSGAIGIKAQHGSGTITLGWTNATDHIYASRYDGTVNIASGQVFVTNDPTPDTITGNNIDKSRINGKTLRPILTGSGTTDDPYLISNAGGWDLFCDLIENSTSLFTDNVKLCANISVSRMAGSESKPFCGNFDGQEYTITFNYNTGNDPIDYIAPFRYVMGSIGNGNHHATISNLNVDSQINGENAIHLAGLIANQKGLVDVTNCHVQVAITSTATTDSYCAGLVSHADLCEGANHYYGNAYDGTLTISGCTVSGSISTYGKYAGGFVGMAEGKTSIVNSVSGVTIHSFVSGNGTHGGFIGLQQNTMNYTGVKTTIEGCLFNGKLIKSENTTQCGGFIGWHDGGELEIKHCLYAPDDLDSNETEISDGSTFVGNGTVGSNCIYTRALGTPQGKASHSIIAGDYVTISNIALINFLSNPDVYNVSDITSYDWGGINCGGDLYFCEGAHVSLELSNDYPDAGSFYGYTVSGGTLEYNGNGTYTLIMPDADVTIATIVPLPVSYIDEHGEEQTVTALPLTGSETALAPGWYVVQNTNPNGVDLAYTEGLSCSDGNLNLILCDGAEMTVTNVDTQDAITLNGAYTLTIYGQSQQSGKLTLTGSEDGQCIHSNSGSIVMNGGIVNATAATDGAIDCYSFTMNGGSFSATSNSNSDDDHAIQLVNSFTFNGGNFSATATNPSSYGIEGLWLPVNLSWTNTSDSFYVSSLGQVNVSIAEGKEFIDEDNTLHTHDDPGEIFGKTLHPFNGCYLPMHLTATAITTTTATLTWEAGNEETQWQVSWSTDGGSTWSTPVTVNNVPQYEITNLSPETTVQAQVKSVCDESVYSAPISITFTTRSLCDAPENLTATPIASSATLNWTGYQDSYNVRYSELTIGDAVTTTEGFEHDNEMPEGWTMLDLGDGENTDELGISSDAAQDGGSYGFRFSSFNGDSEGRFDQYLISPELNNLTALSFAFKSSQGTNDVFRVGYSTTTNDVSAFTWGDETASANSWSTYTENPENIPANAKYFAINYTAVYKYRLYIDNITYTYTPLIVGTWNETNTNVTSPLTISGLTPETQYAWQVQGINADCDGGLTDWSEMGNFTTLLHDPVAYIDEDGQTAMCSEYTVLTGTETSLGTAGQETWYVANTYYNYNHKLSLTGDVHLILCDGAEVYLPREYDNDVNYYVSIKGDDDLTIYGQTNGTGTLYSHMIFTNGAITINGGTVNVFGYDLSGDPTAASILTRESFTVNGGTINTSYGEIGIYVTPNGPENPEVSYNCTINGGTVNVSGNNYGIHAKGDVTINGGQVTALGGESGIAAKNLTLGWTYATDYILANSYSVSNNKTIVAGQAFTDNSGNIYCGTLNYAQLNAMFNKTLQPLTAVSLADNASNTTVIEMLNGVKDIDVTLEGRKLWKDGAWNTLVLPFSMNAGQVTAQLAPTELKELDTENKWANVNGQWTISEDGQMTGLDNGTLYLNFKNASAISAGVPYIVKWDSDDNIVDPVFSGVAIVSGDPTAVTFTGGKFVGTYDYMEYTNENKSILFLGSNNTLYYPQPAHEDPEDETSAMVYPSIGAFRAYFQLDDPASVRAFKLNFGDGEQEAQGISDATRLNNNEERINNKWYTLDGVKLDGQPTKKGLYIHGSKKVVIP